jgi:hypothetical protein
MKHRVLIVGLERRFRRRELANLDAIQRPAVRVGDGAELLLGLRQRDVQHDFAACDAGQQVLQRQRGLAGARNPLDEEEAPPGQTTPEDVVESADSGRRHRRGYIRRLGGHWAHSFRRVRIDAHECISQQRLGVGVLETRSVGIGDRRLGTKSLSTTLMLDLCPTFLRLLERVCCALIDAYPPILVNSGGDRR